MALSLPRKRSRWRLSRLQVKASIPQEGKTRGSVLSSTPIVSLHAPLGADRRAPDISADSVTALSRRVARTCIQIRSFDTPSPVLYIATFEILRDPIHHAMRGLRP